MAIYRCRHNRVGRVVPDDAVAFVGDHEGYAYRLTGGCVIVVFAVDGPATIVEDAFLVLSQSVVMLIGRGLECGTHTKCFFPVDCLGRFFPTTHLQYDIAGGRPYR